MVPSFLQYLAIIQNYSSKLSFSTTQQADFTTISPILTHHNLTNHATTTPSGHKSANSTTTFDSHANLTQSKPHNNYANLVTTSPHEHQPRSPYYKAHKKKTKNPPVESKCSSKRTIGKSLHLCQAAALRRASQI